MLQPRGRSVTPLLLSILLLLSCAWASILYGASRSRPPRSRTQTADTFAIGAPLPGMKPVELSFFENGANQFRRVWGMQEGVGPVLTDGGCFRCHRLPVGGGDSVRLLTFFGKINPDSSFDPLDGSGPTQENEGGLLLQPRSNQAFLPLCTQGGEVIPADANAVENRKAPPTFGLGLIDAIDDQTLTDQAAFEALNYVADGIHGRAATVSTYYPAAPHTIGRFGRKAQMANLLEMAAFAFAHDLGITNTLFPIEDLPQGQDIDPNCSLNKNLPNNPNPGSGGKGMFPLSHFMRYLAPPQVALCTTGDCAQGQAVFTAIGCHECHNPTYTTPAAVNVQTDTSGTSLSSPALSNFAVNLYSDLLLHDLGNADKGVIPAGYNNTQTASPSEWRTTPLWGLQYRTKFLHSGGAGDLNGAILGHSDGVTGEAVIVIDRYKALTPSDQQALLHFLATL